MTDTEPRYTLEQWNQLTDEQRNIVLLMLEYRVPDIESVRRDLAEHDPEEDGPALEDMLYDALNHYLPGEGCLGPEGYDGDDLHGDIRWKFSALIRPATQLAAAIVRERFPDWWGSETLDFWIVIEPAFDSQTRIAVIDWNWGVRPWCYWADDIKCWHFEFETLDALANWVLALRDQLVHSVERYRRYENQGGWRTTDALP